MGRNVTIVLDDETARWARVEAARRDLSVSRFIGEMLGQQRAADQSYERARRSYAARRRAALKAPGRSYPGRSELHER